MGKLKNFIMTILAVLSIVTFFTLSILGFYNAYQEGKAEKLMKDHKQVMQNQ